MDYGRLSRRELQVLCKEHGIPANKTNVFMADQLAALLNGRKDDRADEADVIDESHPDHPEYNAEATEVLEANEVEDLSSHFARQNSLAEDELEGDDAAKSAVPRKARTQTSRRSAKPNSNEAAIPAADDVVMVETSEPSDHEFLMKDTGDADPIAPAAESLPLEESKPKKTKAKGKKSSKAKTTQVEEVPHSPVAQEQQQLNDLEPTLEVMLPMAPEDEDMDGRPAPESAQEAPVEIKPAVVKKSKARGKNSEKVVDVPSAPLPIAETVTGPEPALDVAPTLSVMTTDDVDVRTLPESAPEAAVDIKPAAVKKSKGRGKKSEKLIEVPSAPLPSPEPVEEMPKIVSPTQDEVDATEEKAPVKKPSKVKAKKASKVKESTVAVSELAVDDAQLAPAIEGDGLPCAEDSPAYGLTLNIDVPRQAASAMGFGSLVGDDSFEFQPVPSSLTEILSPLAPGTFSCMATEGCQFRAGRKTGKVCTSCATERDVLSSIGHVRPVVGIPDENEPTAIAEETVLATAPMQSDNKENSVKNVDITKMSMRKLQKEAQKRGLSKRTNLHSAKA